MGIYLGDTALAVLSADNSAKLDVAQAFTALQDFSGGIVGGADTTTPNTAATITLDSRMKVVTPGAAITLSFSTPTGKTFASAPILIKQGATPYAITWGSSAVVLGTAADPVANKAALFSVFTPDGGTSYYVQVGQVQP